MWDDILWYRFHRASPVRPEGDWGQGIQEDPFSPAGYPPKGLTLFTIPIEDYRTTQFPTLSLVHSSVYIRLLVEESEKPMRPYALRLLSDLFRGRIALRQVAVGHGNRHIPFSSYESLPACRGRRPVEALPLT